MRAPSLRWLILSLLCLSTVINYVDRQALAVVVPSLRAELGLSSVDYGTITTFFLIAYTIAQLGAGVLIDRLGTRLGFVIFIVVWSVAAMAHAFAQGALSLGIFRFILGAGEAGNWPAGGKAIAEWFPKARRAFGMAVFDGGSAMGAVIAPPLVAALALTLGWRAAFVATGAAGLLWAVAFWIVYRKPAEHTWLSEEDRAMVLEEVEEAQQGRSRVSLRTMLGERKLWGLMLTRSIATPVWWFYVFWLPDYLSKERGFGLKEIGMFGWIPFVTVDIGKLLGGAMSDRLLQRGYSATLARKSVMALGALAMLGGVQVVAADTAAIAIAWVSLATFGFGLWSANILALHADLFPRHLMATAIGWTGAAASLGGSAFTYATGWVVQTSGYAPVFWTAGSAAMVALLALIFVLGRVEQVRVPAEALA
ncbi:MAG: MFS transporter [Bryobacteraceae bacterium]|nr:MFS transporter [Bryobacteraceae bacterium]